MRWQHLFAVATLRRLPGYAPAAFHSWANPMPERESDLSGPINQPGYDLVTVVFAEELDLLALQARSFALFLDDSFSGSILVIVNDLRCTQLAREIERRIVPLYGRWQKRVRLVPFHRLAHRLDPSNGWIVQQALKLAAARIIDRAHYIVFDAKNHLIAPVGTSTFFDTSGAARQMVQDTSSCMPRHQATCADYMGVKPHDRTAQFVPMTPFVIHTETARELVRHVETREQATLSDFFCDTRFVSEFLLYGSFIAQTPQPLRLCRYVHAPSQTVTVWKHSGSIAEAILEARDPAVMCFGMHREVLKNLGGGQSAVLTDFWRERGLLRPGETLDGLASRAGARAFRRNIPVAVGLAGSLATASTMAARLNLSESGDLAPTCICLAIIVGTIALLLGTDRLCKTAVQVGPSLAMIAALLVAIIITPRLARDFGRPDTPAFFALRPPPPPDMLGDLLDFGQGGF